MEDWWKILATAAGEVEQFVQELGKAVESFTDEVNDTVEAVAEQVQSAIVIEIDQYVQDFFDLMIEAGIEIEEIIFYEDLEDWEDESEFVGIRHESPNSKQHPACVGCCHYHGVVYGENLLVCAMHPYGWDDENCPDWEGDQHNYSKH